MGVFLVFLETPIIALFPGKGDVTSGWPWSRYFLLESPNPGGWPLGHGPLMATQVLLLSLASILAQRKHLALLYYKIWKDRLLPPKPSLLLGHKRKQGLQASHICTLSRLESASRLCVLQRSHVEPTERFFWSIPHWAWVAMLGTILMHLDFKVSFVMSLYIILLGVLLWLQYLKYWVYYKCPCSNPWIPYFKYFNHFKQL